jgi:hypothetical protein
MEGSTYPRVFGIVRIHDMTFGFRLYTARLAEETGYTSQPWKTSNFDYAEHLTQVGGSLRQKARVTSSGNKVWPNPHPADLSMQDIKALSAPMPAAMGRSDMVGRVGSIRAIHPRRIHITATIGRVGAFDVAMGEQDDPLTDRAAARKYRAVLLLPPPTEECGLLAVETIGRTTPNAEILNLLALGSKYRALVTGNSWYRLRIEQVADADRLDEILTEDSAAVVLTRNYVDGSGDRRRSKDLRLEGSVSVEHRGTLRGWLGLPTSDRKAKGLNGMLEILGEQNTLDDVGFNDGFVKIGSGVNSTKVRLGDMADRFTYPIQEDVRPDQQTWERAVRDRARILRPQLDW